MHDLPWAKARDMLAVNVTAVVHLTTLVLAEMRERDSGHIVNISSISGSIPSQGVAPYCATKSFVDAFSDALYRELRDTHVRVSTVRPGAVKGTGFYEFAAPLRVLANRLGTTPEGVAWSVWRLLLRPRKTVWVPAALGVVRWFEFCCGWLIDRVGPLLLRRRAARAALVEVDLPGSGRAGGSGDRHGTTQSGTPSPGPMKQCDCSKSGTDVVD